MSDKATRAAAATLSHKVKHFRMLQSLSLSALAATAGVSRGMLIQIEGGKTNPTLTTLIKIAGALGVSLPELLETQQPSPIRVIDFEDGATLWTGPHGGRGRMLAGSSGRNQLQVWDWQMEPGESFDALPQSRGTVEIIHVLRGRLALRVGDETREIPATKTVMFHPDCPHGYRNEARSPLRMIISNSEPRTQHSVGQHVAVPKGVADEMD